MKLLFSFLFTGMVATLLASTSSINCTSATLAEYEGNFSFPGGGCAIGILDYYTFTYHPISNAPTDAEIQLNPISTGGFEFVRADGQQFVANAGEIVKFEIDYQFLIDPAPIIGGGLFLDPPSGNVTVTAFYCNDGQYFFSGACFGRPIESLIVGTIPPLQLQNHINFVNPAGTFQEIGLLFTLDGTNGRSTFDGLESTPDILLIAAPEPASVGGVLAGMFALAAICATKKRRASRI